jgi:DNA-binding CsgD family transcriptional regulator
MNLNGIMMIEKNNRSTSHDQDFNLTYTELTCLKLTANGLRPIEIGTALKTGEQEVDGILTSAQAKLGARNRLHAVGIAVSQGLIGIDGK